MALTRSELKDIIKECILEVMLEGINPGARPQAKNVQESSRAPAALPSGKKHLDSISFSDGASRVASQAQGRKAIPPIVNELATAFPVEQRDIMKQIFEDTVRNTLPSQMSAERSPGSALAQRADDVNGVTNVDPMSIFEGASNWADLAFASSKKAVR
jgi:hypothetical protein